MISRSRQVLLVEVYDWDYTHDDELLGVANIDLSNIPALTTTPFSVDLDTQGKVNLRATFFPEYIRPPLDAKSAIPIDLGAVSDVGMKAVGGAASLATGAVGGGIGAASDQLNKGAGFLKSFKSKRGRNSKDKNNNDDSSSLAPSAISQSKSSVSDDGGHNLKPDIPEEEKELREEQGEEIESIQAAPNIREQDLPKPQQPFVPHGNVRGHQRNVSNATDVSSFAASIHGADALQVD